jgi:hypothetical protein
VKKGDNLHTKPDRGRKVERMKNLSTGTVAGKGKKSQTGGTILKTQMNSIMPINSYYGAVLYATLFVKNKGLSFEEAEMFPQHDNKMNDVSNILINMLSSKWWQLYYDVF